MLAATEAEKTIERLWRQAEKPEDRRRLYERVVELFEMRREEYWRDLWGDVLKLSRLLLDDPGYRNNEEILNKDFQVDTDKVSFDMDAGLRGISKVSMTLDQYCTCSPALDTMYNKYLKHQQDQKLRTAKFQASGLAKLTPEERHALGHL